MASYVLSKTRSTPPCISNFEKKAFCPVPRLLSKTPDAKFQNRTVQARHFQSRRKRNFDFLKPRGRLDIQTQYEPGPTPRQRNAQIIRSNSNNSIKEWTRSFGTSQIASRFNFTKHNSFFSNYEAGAANRRPCASSFWSGKTRLITSKSLTHRLQRSYSIQKKSAEPSITRELLIQKIDSIQKLLQNDEIWTRHSDLEKVISNVGNDFYSSANASKTIKEHQALSQKVDNWNRLQSILNEYDELTSIVYYFDFIL